VRDFSVLERSTWLVIFALGESRHPNSGEGGGF
jgi:hypothetical protein